MSGPTASPDAVRQQRAAAATRWRPGQVRLLLIAEAPPDAPDRYFYFEQVSEHDGLFRHVAEALLGSTPSRAEKPAALGTLRGLGVSLIDVSEDPVDRRHDLRPHIDGLVSRAAALRPEHVILIKANVHNEVLGPLRAVGLPVSAVRVPFPGQGQQAKFKERFAVALEGIGWQQPAAATR